MDKTPLPRIIALAGTNASGKSAMGIALAQQFDGEIISADSRQIYRGFDLCCGKVTEEERRMIPHHMLDVAQVGDTYSVMDYQKKAYQLIDDIRARGKLPFLVGGTGLYIDAVVKGYLFDETPPDPSLRGSLNALPLDELREQVTGIGVDLAELGPSEQYNPRRLIRILERAASGTYTARKNKPRFNALQLGVTWPKETLHKRIDERLDARLREGMLDEVKSYLALGGNRAALEDLGLEYRYICRYLMGEYASQSEFRDALSVAIKRFAKRQTTWFGRNRDILWLDMSCDPLARAQEEIRRFLDRP